MNQYLFDVVVPIYNSPRHALWCLESVVRHSTPGTFRLILINDRSDEHTSEVLRRWSDGRKNVVLVESEKNLGFLGSANRGMAISTAPFVVLLNSDAIVTPGWLEKLHQAFERDPRIGLITPLSNSAANITIHMPDGYDFYATNELVEQRTRRLYPDAMTVVGYCLAIRRRLIVQIGLFDGVYGRGYCEETDYHFKCLHAGWRAVIADDIYLYHTGEASFTDRSKRYERNLKIFRERWGAEYDRRLLIYKMKNQLGYLRRARDQTFLSPAKLEYDVLFVLPGAQRGSGGPQTVIDLVNRLILRGIRAMIAFTGPARCGVEMLFTPLRYRSLQSFTQSPPRARVYVATHYSTVRTVAQVAYRNKATASYFIQDYEGYFDNATRLSEVVRTYNMVRHRIVISQWLKDLLMQQHGLTSTLLPIGVSVHEFYPRQPVEILQKLKARGDFLVFGMVRLDDRRGYPFILEAARRSAVETPNLHWVLCGDAVPSESLTNVTFLGVLNRLQTARYLASCDAFVDASMFQGFGLMGLEAMASGAVPVLTESGGSLQYAQHSRNCLMVPPRDVKGILNALEQLRTDPDLFRQVRDGGLKTAMRSDWESLSNGYFDYFQGLLQQDPPNAPPWESGDPDAVVDARQVNPFHFRVLDQMFPSRGIGMAVKLVAKAYLYSTHYGGRALVKRVKAYLSTGRSEAE